MNILSIGYVLAYFVSFKLVAKQVLQIYVQSSTKSALYISDASLLITPMNKVQTIIAEEAKAYFTGQKSADDVAKLIQNRVTTYINE
ncbi:hypothetical protein ACFQZT_06310 [Paenibacillus sp. GCM10027628]|uniref:hypothetical protein n=1 Tax=Paenibacillus sp. GCM10027628 TaxID=3273413 RepID=UPI0036426359